jgi:hypothetical protein
LLDAGKKLLTMRPASYKIGGSEHTLLATSQEVEGRIFTLAGLYRITGDRRFAARATEEMLAAAAFPDWNPAHFLDTAEMTAALGLGYDWLYATLSPADRATIKNAIVAKGIDPQLTRIHNGTAEKHHNNWSQVCNGGETLGALAIADEEPKRAGEILDHARSAIADIMQLFAPDGGFEEGPKYWAYATIYNVLYIDALDSALGTDFGASGAKGFSKTPDYHIQAIGPTGELANFGDGADGSAPAAQMFWFARRFEQPAYAAFERNFAGSGKPAGQGHGGSNRFAILEMFWAARAPTAGSTAPLPLVESFARVSQAYLRSAWGDPNAWYLGFKGGDGQAHHGHLDLGSFVMDALGQRWAIDLGADNYTLPSYFGKGRAVYYRLRTEGHNTLTVDGQSEDLDAQAPLAALGTTGSASFAIADLGQAYKGKLNAWSRGVALLDNRRVLVQDEIAPTHPVDVVWNFHTRAIVHIAADGRSATLTQGGATLHARILAPASARFATASTEVPAPQASNPGVTNLVFRLPKQATAETIAVLFTGPDDTLSPQIKPLSKWR